MDSRTGTLASYIEKNYSVLLAAGEKMWDMAKDIMNSYSAEEVRIINQVVAIMCKDTKPENYPLQLRFSSSSTAERKFPAYILPSDKLELDQSRIGDNRLVPYFTAIIEHLISCYNSRTEKWLTSNSKAINHVFLYLIDIMYYFSGARLNNLGMLEQLDLYMGYIEKIMTIEEIKNKFFDSKDDDARQVLSKGLFLLLNNCKPVIIDIRKKYSAAELLDQMADATTNLCHVGFNLALHIVSKEKLSTAISLVNIEREKNRNAGDEEVRKYAIDPIVQGIKLDHASFQWYIYNLSSSLIDRFENRNSKKSKYKPYVKPHLASALIKDTCDIYTPLKEETFLKYYLEFSADLEKFSELSKLIELAKTTCDGRGDIFYFVIANHASKTLLTQISTILSSFTEAYENILNITRLQNLANSDAVKTKENESWQNSYNMVVMKDAPAIEIRMKKIKTLCTDLEKLHSEFSNNPIDKINEIYDQANTFCSKIYSFQNTLIAQKYHKANNLFLTPPADFTFVEDLEANILEAKSDYFLPASVTAETDLIYPPLEEKISFYTEEFKNIINKKTLAKFEKDLKKYCSSEKNFLEVLEVKQEHSNKYKHDFKECYQHYCVLDDGLKKIRVSNDLNLENKKIVFELQIELANRQIQYLVNLIIQKKSTVVDLNGSMERFSQRCLLAREEKLGDSPCENKYIALMKKIYRNLDVKAFKPNDADLLSLLPVEAKKSVEAKKIVEEKKSDAVPKPADHFLVGANQQRFFLNKPLAVSNMNEVISNTVVINNINSVSSKTLSSEDIQQIVNDIEPQAKSEYKPLSLNINPNNNNTSLAIYTQLNGGAIYDPKRVGIKLKQDVDISLPTIAQMLYEALNESELEANSGYNGWNLLIYKTENEKRHKKYREDYQALLQYVASAYPYLVVDDPSPDRYIPAGQMLNWIDRVTQNEKKYWCPYRLYARLNSIAEELRPLAPLQKRENESADRVIGENSTSVSYKSLNLKSGQREVDKIENSQIVNAGNVIIMQNKK